MVILRCVSLEEVFAEMNANGYFHGAQLRLAQAIESDNADAVNEALNAGAGLDAPGKEGITPLHFALVQKKKRSVTALLERGADPNKRSNNGQNTMTLATRLAPYDSEYLRLALKYGGNPNTLEPDHDPILATMIGQNNPEAIKILSAAKADLNVLDRTRSPAILAAAYMAHWNCVWTLIDLGADWRVADKGGATLAWIAHQSALNPDSPMYPWLQKVIEFLKSRGITFPPPSPQETLSHARLGKSTVVYGEAQNDKGAAVIIIRQADPVYVEGLNYWPAEMIGKPVEVHGKLVRKKIIPDSSITRDGAVSQIASVQHWVVEGATWKLR